MFDIDRVLEDMDPDKRAAVHAGVLRMYQTKSKKLPARGMKRKSAGGPAAEEVADAQEDIDREDRRLKATFAKYDDPDFKPPDWVKRRLSTLEKKGELDVGSFCKEIDVTKEEYYQFLKARKKDDQYASKVYHDAVPWLLKRAEQNMGKENKRPRVTSKTG